jgi:hypothetical protein
LFVPFCFRDQLFDRGGEGRNVFGDDVPGRRDADALVFVAEEITDRRNLTPGDAGGQGLLRRRGCVGWPAR